MKILPASPRKRRRLAWIATAAVIAAGIGVAAFVVPNPGPQNAAPTTNEGPAQLAARLPPRLSTADRRAIDRTLDRFIPAAVGRQSADLAWSLAGPELRSGSTLAQWRAGTSPVPSYPVKVEPFHDWSTLDIGKRYVDFTLLVHPRRGAKVGAWSFAGQMVERDGRWLVNRLYTIAIFQPVRGSKHEIGPADFAAPPPASSSPAGKSVLGGIGLAPIAVVLALIVLTPLAFGLIAIRRARRFRREAAARRSAELPPLPRPERPREPAGRP
ncbi:MAG TPA: hypothetical protein VE982_05235 [Gaiellaceae bacterium]|nr:hypothetical protein [Gaiellaceae bacterium]